MKHKKSDIKTLYAQSSDIKARNYLEYRKDMKKKAIAELEILDWLQKKVEALFPYNKEIKVYKSGSDKFIWFLRRGGITREPDFIAYVDKNKIEFEFQYADKPNLNFYDFKVSKVTKKVKGEYKLIENKYFVYIHKVLKKFLIVKSDWIKDNGSLGFVEAWRSYAYRIPKEIFESKLTEDNELVKICETIDKKNELLNFQHELIEIEKNNLSYLLESVIDEKKIVKIVPQDLESFYKVCFILDNIESTPKNGNLWLIYLLSFIKEDLILEKIFKIIYCIDFLYNRIELKSNELDILILNLDKLIKLIIRYYNNLGYFHSSKEFNQIQETRFAIFSINLYEDLIQDIIYHYGAKNLKPIKKIYENVPDIDKIYEFIIY